MYEEIKNKLEKLYLGDGDLKISVERKGMYKYQLLLFLLENVIKIENVDSKLLLETYKFFIRLRRFIFKWVNQIEDYMTSIIEVKTTEKYKDLYTSKTFAAKQAWFKKEEFYHSFIKKHSLLEKFSNFDDYKEKLEIICQLRNSVSHLDLFYLNFTKDNNKSYILGKCITCIKYFIWEECGKGDAKNHWKGFDRQLKELFSKNLEDKKYQYIIKVLRQIYNFNFEGYDLFLNIA